MSTKPATATAVSKLFVAAGRRANKEELAVYHEALAGVDDDALAAAVRLTIQNVDLWQRPPTPALIRQAVDAVLRDRPRPPAVGQDSDAPCSPDEYRAGLAAARAASHQGRRVVLAAERPTA